jgi:LAGLIDADG endonuclease
VRRSGHHITPENIAGLVVGEGCFYAESAPDHKYKLGWRIRPAFCIEMRLDDLEVLEAVRDQIGCGGIYKLDFGRYKNYRDKMWLPHAKYRVSAVSDLYANVIPFFDSHPLFGRKEAAFRIFRELVGLLHGKGHLEPVGLARAKTLAEALSAHNARGAAAHSGGAAS